LLLGIPPTRTARRPSRTPTGHLRGPHGSTRLSNCRHLLTINEDTLNAWHVLLVTVAQGDSPTGRAQPSVVVSTSPAATVPRAAAAPAPGAPPNWTAPLPRRPKPQRQSPYRLAAMPQHSQTCTAGRRRAVQQLQRVSPLSPHPQQQTAGAAAAAAAAADYVLRLLLLQLLLLLLLVIPALVLILQHALSQHCCGWC
jgi:hypothetical protein